MQIYSKRAEIDASLIAPLMSSVHVSQMESACLELHLRVRP